MREERESCVVLFAGNRENTLRGEMRVAFSSVSSRESLFQEFVGSSLREYFPYSIPFTMSRELWYEHLRGEFGVVVRQRALERENLYEREFFLPAFEVFVGNRV